MDFDLNEEQRMWRKTVHDFVSAEVRPFAREADETGEFNWAAVRKMGPLGLLGLNIPEAYGGPGIDAVSAAIAIEEIGWGCGSMALAIAATATVFLYLARCCSVCWVDSARSSSPLGWHLCPPR